MAWKDKWGYKGTETALNGLTLWIESKIQLKGSADSRHKQCCQMVIEYGEANIPNYKKYGHLEVAAGYVAKKIQRNNKFNHFTEWILNPTTNEQ